MKNLKGLYNNWHSTEYDDDNKSLIELKTRKSHDLILSYMDEAKSFQKGKKLLDIACGKGLFLKEAKKKGLDIFGLDISDVAIDQAEKELPKGNFIAGDAENLPYGDDEFDYVSCIGSLEHFIRPAEAVQEISRVLKKSGIALIHLPNLMFLGHIYMAYKHGLMPSEGEQSFSEVFYTFKGWEKLLEENNLKVIECKSYNRIHGSRKVSKVVSFFWNNIFKFFVPFNLSYIFIFICRKK